jgi:hypothetical protein
VRVCRAFVTGFVVLIAAHRAVVRIFVLPVILIRLA